MNFSPNVQVVLKGEAGIAVLELYITKRFQMLSGDSTLGLTMREETRSGFHGHGNGQDQVSPWVSTRAGGMEGARGYFCSEGGLRASGRGSPLGK